MSYFWWWSVISVNSRLKQAYFFNYDKTQIFHWCINMPNHVSQGLQFTISVSDWSYAATFETAKSSYCLNCLLRMGRVGAEISPNKALTRHFFFLGERVDASFPANPLQDRSNMSCFLIASTSYFSYKGGTQRPTKISFWSAVLKNII